MTAEERSVLAGEFALGVLEAEERAEALRLLLADRDFAREVEWWRDRFAALFAEIAEATPDPALEGRIMAALPGAAANDDAVRPSRAARLWRAVAAVATVAAACLLAALLLRPERIPPPPAPSAPAAPAPLVAALNPTPDGDDVADAPFAAVFDRAAGAVTLASALELPAGRVAELWTIGADGVPRSVGVLSGGASPRVPVSADARARLARGVTLAISIEPPGGSPTGSPTGPVIATGTLAAV